MAEDTIIQMDEGIQFARVGIADLGKMVMEKITLGFYVSDDRWFVRKNEIPSEFSGEDAAFYIFNVNFFPGDNGVYKLQPFVDNVVDGEVGLCECIPDDSMTPAQLRYLIEEL